MGNCIFAWPNMVDQTGSVSPTLSGGSWLPELPLTNLKDPILARVARSTDALRASTQFDVDLASSAAYSRIFSIPRHNMSSVALLRIRGSSVAGSFGKAQTLRADSAGSYRYKTLPAFGTTGTKAASLFIKAPATTPATSFKFRVYKTNGSPAAVLDVDVVIAAGVPTPTAATGTHNGTDAPVDGWYRVRCTTTSITSTDSHRFEIYPNGASGSGLDVMVFGVMIEDDASHDTYQSGGPNLLSNPDTYDIQSWTLGAGGTTLVNDGQSEPNSGQVYDTGWLDVWPIMWPEGVLPWGHPNLWTRRLTDDQIASYHAGFIHIAPDAYNARYWRLEIDDETNSAGYVDLARLVMSPGYEPSVNFSYGAQTGMLSETTYEQSLGGARFFDQRPIRRNAILSFPELPIDESLSVVQEMLRDLQTSGQVLFIFDATDDIHLFRRSFLATFRELGAIEYAYFGAGAVVLALEEVL